MTPDLYSSFNDLSIVCMPNCWPVWMSVGREQLLGHEIDGRDGEHADDGRGHIDGNSGVMDQEMTERDQVAKESFSPKVGGEKDWSSSLDDGKCIHAIGRLVVSGAWWQAVDPVQAQEGRQQRDGDHQDGPLCAGWCRGRHAVVDGWRC